MKDGVIIFGQKPTLTDILADLDGLNVKLPCYGSVRTADRSYTGEFRQITINCDCVHLIIAQDRRNGHRKTVKIPEEFTIPIALITRVWEFPNPLNY